MYTTQERVRVRHLGSHDVQDPSADWVSRRCDPLASVVDAQTDHPDDFTGGSSTFAWKRSGAFDRRDGTGTVPKCLNADYGGEALVVVYGPLPVFVGNGALRFTRKSGATPGRQHHFNFTFRQRRLQVTFKTVTTG